MTLLHSVLYPLRLVWARLGSWSGPVVLVVVGIAAGAAVVVGGRAGAVVAQDRAVAQAVERIPDGSRSVRAVWFGVPGQSDERQPVLERRARAALKHAVAGDARALVLFRESTIGGTFAGIGGVDGLGTQVTLRSGRLPTECRPERCEVLRLRGAGGRLPEPAGLKLVEVGTAALKSRLLFGDFLAPTDNALDAAEVSPAFARAARYHRPAPPPLFLAEGVKTLAGAPALDASYRSYAWVVPLEAGRPRLWEVDDLAAGVARARSELQAVTSSFDLVAPVEELREAQATSRAAGRRLGIVGGEAAALLFAFALLAAMTLRTDLAAARRRLAWYGARGWQLALVTVAESAALALAGTVLGLAVGALGGAFVAHRAGEPVGEILSRSAFSVQGLGLCGARCSRCDGCPRGGCGLPLVASHPGPLLACRRGCARRGLARAARAVARRRRGRSRPAPPGARDVRGGGSRRPCVATCAAAGRAARRAAGRSGAARVLFALAQSGLRGRCDRVSRRLLRARALRGELSSDACPRRARSGGASRPARLRRPRGSAAADPGPGCRVTRPLRPARSGGRARAPRDRERCSARRGKRDHAAGASAGDAAAAARLA